MENERQTLDSDIFENTGDKEKIVILPIVWILLGIIGVLIGLNGYYRYTQPVLFTIMVSNDQYLRDIVFGLLSIGIGIMLFTQKYNATKLVYAYPMWVIGFIFFGTIINSIQFKHFESDLIFTVDYLFILLSINTINRLNGEEEFSKSDIIPIIKTHKRFLAIGMFLLLALIWSLYIVFPYEFFHKFRS